MSGLLDREVSSSHTLLVQAYDNYQHGFTTGDSRSSFLQLTVEVSDVNDEAPQFVEVESQCSTISEFHRANEPIVNIRAFDKDDPESANSEIILNIKHGNEKGFFRIESVGRGLARIYPFDTLKGHYGNYSLHVEAQDKGFPPNFKIAVYDICVQVWNVDDIPVILISALFRISMIMLQRL